MDVLDAGRSGEIEVQLGLEEAIGLELAQFFHGSAQIEAGAVAGFVEIRVVGFGLAVVAEESGLVLDDLRGDADLHQADGLEFGLELLGEIVVVGSEDVAEGEGWHVSGSFSYS